MKKYYVMGSKNKVAHILRVPIIQEDQVFVEREFPDITFIDALFTLNLTKNEILSLLQEYNPSFFQNTNEKDMDIFIARVSFNEKKKTYAVRFYDLLYRYSSLRVAPKIEEGIKKEALERMESVQNQQKILLQLDNKFKNFLHLLLSYTTGSPDTKCFLLRPESIVDPEIKKNIRSYYRSTDYLVYHKLETDLRSYKNLRGFCLEFLQSNSLNPVNFKEKNFERKHYVYPSELFGYPYDFTLTLDEINYIPRDYVPPVSYEDEMVAFEAKIFQYILQQPFSNPEMQYYYEQGGISAIFENMDANDIYGVLTDEDKVKLNLLSIQKYVEMNWSKIYQYLQNDNKKQRRSK